MRLYQYLGKKTQNLARQGMVKKNGRVSLSEEEAFYVRGDKKWKPLKEDITGFPEDELLPVEGRYFDLSALPWKQKKIFQAVSRLRRTALLNALAQLEDMGFPLPASPDSLDNDACREAVLRIGRIAGWV